VIDAENERAARGYQSYGALPMLDAPLSLVCCRTPRPPTR
jgi:hypothetical protein